MYIAQHKPYIIMESSQSVSLFPLKKLGDIVNVILEMPLEIHIDYMTIFVVLGLLKRNGSPKKVRDDEENKKKS